MESPFAIVAGLLVLVLITLVLLLGALWSLVRHRRCPACGTPMESLQVPERGEQARTFEILRCPREGELVVLAGGARGRHAWCPACRQRSLAVRVDRTGDDPPVLEVEELCTLCSYEESWGIEEELPPTPPRGLVVRFPPGEEG